MLEFKRNGAIIASGMAVPDRIVPNSYFNELLGEDVDTWLRNNVQIYNRRWLSDGESMADLIETACLQAMERGNIKAEEIDLLIIATDTPEFVSPATASVIQDRLKLVNAGTFDLNAACSGFVAALDTASKYIQADSQYHNVMVVGAYAMSRYLDVKDKKTATLFADGAAAVILKAETDGRGLLQSQLSALGEYNSWMGIYAGGSAQPVTHEVLEGRW
jgi:3-oxoacyl-[acyl-carrier-protein] synthase-3